jgi:hypothetical protein
MEQYETMKNKILICSLVIPQLLFSQVWVENFVYNGPSLDSSKWTTVAMSHQEYLSISFPSSTMRVQNNVGDYPFLINKWHQELPLNHDWTVLQRMKYDNVFNETTSILMINNENIIDYRANAANWTPSIHSFSDPYKLINENWDYHWIGMSYNSVDKTINTLFSYSSASIAPELSEFTIFASKPFDYITDPVVSIKHMILFAGKGAANYSDFNIISTSVPEPSALSLLAVGLGGLAMMRRRRS